MSFRVLLEKENFKFSGSHFTIFSASRAERLHGHNYYLSLELRFSSVDEKLGLQFDFNDIKPLVREVATELDEFVLLPAHSPHLKVIATASEVRAIFADKQYSFPAADVRILPLVNISSEELARYIAGEIKLRLKKLGPVAEPLKALTVGVQESRGQSVFYETTF